MITGKPKDLEDKLKKLEEEEKKLKLLEIEKKTAETADITTSEEAKAKGLLFLAHTKRPDLLSELDEKEIKLITTIDSLADHFDIRLYKTITKEFKNHRVSFKRKGRGELMTISKGPIEEKFGKLQSLMPWVKTQ